MLLASLIITLEIMIGAALGSTLIAWLYAWSSQQLPVVERRASLLAIVIAAALPLYVHASGWEATWGKFGWIPMIQAGTTRQWNINGLAATIWIHAISGAAGAALFLTWAWRFLPASMFEAARLEATQGYVLRRIVGPFVLPLSCISGGWSALLVATDMTVADLYSIRTLPDLVYQQFALKEGWYAGGLATLFAVALVAAILTGLNRFQQLSGQWTPSRHRPQTFGGPLLNRARVLCWMTCCMVTAVPIVGLILKAGWTTELESGGNLHAMFTWRTLLATVLDAFPRFHTELQWSFELALLVTLLAMPLAIATVTIARKGPVYRFTSIGFVTLLVFIPGPMWSLAIVWTLSQSWLPGAEFLYSNTLLPTAVAALPRSYAVATAMIAIAVGNLPRGYEEVLRLDGVQGLFRWRRVEWPLLRGYLATALLLSGFLAIGDLAANLLVSPPDVQTVSVRLFGLLHSGIRRQEAGLCLLTVTCEIMLVVVAWLCHDGSVRRVGRAH